MSTANHNDVQVLNAANTMESTLLLIQEKAKHSEVAFYKINLGHVVQQFLRWKRLVPRAQPFFAIKCQPDPKVIAVLGKLGAGFDCASMHEVKTVVETMCFNECEAADKIIFANPFKFKKDVQYANKVGVSMTTFDTESELLKLSQDWPSAQLVLRISPQKAYQASSVLGNKFGADTHEVATLLQRAKELSMNVIGFSFHVGSGCLELNAFPETVVYCARVAEIAREIGFNPYLLDIGGGFPGLSSTGDDSQKQMDFEKMCGDLNVVLDTYFPENSGYRIISEPGRYFVMGAYTLTTQVIGKRTLDVHNPLNNAAHTGRAKETDNKTCDDAIQQGFRYIINDGVYNSFNCIVFDHADPKPLLIFNSYGSVREMNNDAPKFVSTMFGPTCDGLDCVLQQVPLPELEVEDWLVWANMGAYTIAASSCFNGIPMAERDYYMCDEDLNAVEKNCQRAVFLPEFEE